jgi:methylmalonyl-CoA mutase
VSDTEQAPGGALEGGLDAPPDITELSLAADFPLAGEDAWAELVAGVLRKSGALADGASAGAAIEKLTGRTAEGIALRPLYTRSGAQNVDAGFPGVFPFVRGARARGSHDTGWDVRAHYADADVARTRRQVLADLEGGTNSVWLQVGPGAIPVEGIDEVLADVYLDSAAVALDGGAQGAAAADALLASAVQRGVAPSALTGSLGFDPVGLQARTGITADFGPTLSWARRCLTELTGLRALTVDGRPYHEAGGSHAQELAFSLAAAVRGLREMEAAGIAPSDAVRLFEFRIAVTDEQFLSIAKLRAARLLWAKVTESSGARGPLSAQRQHAVSSWAMATRRDPWVNMLRGALACFGGGVGGAEAVTVLPFDVAVGLPDAFSRRVARNTHAILLSESHLARVIDPAGGSWYVESLTRDLARAAWEIFRQVEAAGGIGAALQSGEVAEQLAETRVERERRYADRSSAITGVSEFPLLQEAGLQREPYPSQAVSAGLPRHRYAEAYEALRDRADVFQARTGRAPAIFVAALGATREHSARLGFLSGALSPGGIDVQVHDVDPDEVDAVGAAFAAEPGTIAAICGTDKAYAASGPAVVAALRKAGATHLIVAGKPGAEPAVQADRWVYIGCDLVAALTEVHDVLEANA